MAREILPTTSDGVEVEVNKNWTVDRGEETVTTKTGPRDTIAALYEDEKLQATYDGLKSGVSFRSSRGRGTLTTTDARLIANAPDPATDDGMQELLGIDVIMPIYRAPYFADLATSDIALARKLVDDGVQDPTGYFSGATTTKAYQLFGHLILGMTTYYETSYLFRRSYRSSSSKQVRLAASNQNEVVDLPRLSSTLKNLIDELPDGEWLKRPTQCRYLGKNGWDVSDEYLWAPEWSIVYGGSFNGGYA